MDTQSILKTALAEHEDSQSSEITVETLSADVEEKFKDVESVCASSLPSLYSDSSVS